MKQSKRFKKWLLLASLCAGVVFFHQPLVLFSVKWALPSEGVSYEKMEWEGGVIVLSGLVVREAGSELSVDRVELKPAGEWLKARFAPMITVVHPQLIMEGARSEGGSSCALLYRSRFFQPQWEVKNGVLELRGSRFYFAMEPKEEMLGSVRFSYDPLAEAVLTADLRAVDEDLEVGFELQMGDLSRLGVLASLMFPELPREEVSGDVELKGSVRLDKEMQMQEVHLQGRGQSVVLGKMLRCEELEGSFSFLTGEEFSASLQVEGGECALKEGIEIKSLAGKVVFEPAKEPELALEGVVCQGERELPLHLLGKGGLQEDATFWSEVEVTLGRSHALCSVSRFEEGALALHMKVEEAGFEELDLVRALGGFPGECVEGTASAEVTFLYKGGNWQSVAFDKCLLDHVRWYFPGREVTIFSEQIEGECTFSQDGTPHLHLRVQGGEYVDSRYFLSGFKGELALKDHLANLQLSGEIAEVPAVLNVAAKFQGNLVSLEGRGSIAEEAFEASALVALLPAFELKGGKFSAESLTRKSYGVFWPGDLDLTLEKIEGDWKWEGGFQVPHLYAVCNGIALRGKLEVKEGIHFSTDQMAGDVKDLVALFPEITVPISGNFSSGEQGMRLKASGGDVEWSFAGRFENVCFPVNELTWMKGAHGTIAIDSKEKSLKLEGAEGIWELKDKTALTVQLKRMSVCQGSLDLALKVVQGKREFAQFEVLAIESVGGEWSASFNPQTTHVGGALLQIQRCYFEPQKGVTAFEMRPSFKGQDVHAYTSLLQNAGLLPATFSAHNVQEWGLDGALHAQVFSESMGEGFSFQVQSPDLRIKGTSLGKFHVHGEKRGERWRIEKLQTGGLQIQGSLFVDADKVSISQFEGNWNGVFMKGSGFATQKDFSCTLESIKGDFSWGTLKGKVLAGAVCKGSFPNSELTGEANVYLDLEAPFPAGATAQRKLKFQYKKERGLVCQGIDFQLKHKRSGAHLAKIQAGELHSSGKGFSLKQLEFSLTPAFLGFAIDAKLLPAEWQEMHWEGSLEGGGDLQLTEAGAGFQGHLRPGRYGWKEKSLLFEQVQLYYEKQLLTLRAKAQIEEEPLWASLQLDVAKEPYGMLKLFDHPKAEGLKILFSTQKGAPVLESAQGSCYGLTCSLAKKKAALSGEIKMDGNLFLNLLPKTIREGLEPFHIGRGYSWQGDLFLGQEGFLATGTLRGRDFEFLGYQLQNLEAALEVTPESCVLSGLKITDPAGGVSIPTITLQKKKEWHLHIPEILARSVQPSRMRKVGVEPSEIKPFIIQHFTLEDIQGRLSDKSTLYGSGRLVFVNQFKKEQSIFDAPLEMLKKFGLDLALLTPVQGEIQMELRGDKFYLISLDNAFSEGERAEFYLSPEKNISFIDLDGKMHIDLKMRQDVVFKITEPFTLTIRGTLDKPRYGLQF
jgi:hypothetical protein